MTQANHLLDVLVRGERLNRAAAAVIHDVNASHLIVHGVLARAMGGQIRSATGADLDADLACALALYPQHHDPQNRDRRSVRRAEAARNAEVTPSPRNS
jgi:hypothetical protein